MGNKILVESKRAMAIREEKDFRKLDKLMNDEN